MHMLNLISQIVIYYIYVYYCNSVEANCLLQSVTRRTLAIVVSFDFFLYCTFFSTSQREKGVSALQRFVLCTNALKIKTATQ